MLYFDNCLATKGRNMITSTRIAKKAPRSELFGSVAEWIGLKDVGVTLQDFEEGNFWKFFSKTDASRFSSVIVHLSAVQRHHLVKGGVPSKVVRDALDTYHCINHDLLLGSIGLSSKTLDRRQKDRLNEHHSDAALALMEVTALAESALGTRDLAEEWLNSPAIGLDGKKPLEMLTTAPGIAAVKELLGRIEYGVYA